MIQVGGQERSEIVQAAVVYERAQYVPGTDEDADVHLLLQSLETLWATYVGTNVEEPPGGRWWPFAPSNGS